MIELTPLITFASSLTGADSVPALDAELRLWFYALVAAVRAERAHQQAWQAFSRNLAALSLQDRDRVWAKLREAAEGYANG